MNKNSSASKPRNQDPDKKVEKVEIDVPEKQPHTEGRDERDHSLNKSEVQTNSTASSLYGVLGQYMIRQRESKEKTTNKMNESQTKPEPKREDAAGCGRDAPSQGAAGSTHASGMMCFVTKRRSRDSGTRGHKYNTDGEEDSDSDSGEEASLFFF